MKYKCVENLQLTIGSFLFFFNENKEYEFEKKEDNFKLKEGQMGQLSNLIELDKQTMEKYFK